MTLQRGILILIFLLLLSSNAYSFPYNGLDINIAASITETYDDNVNFTSVSKKSDLLTDLSLGLGIRYEGKRTSMGFRGAIQKRLSAKGGNSDPLFPNISLDLRNELSENVSLSDTFTQSYYRAEFTDIFVGAKGDYSSYNNNFSLRYHTDITREVNLFAQYNNTQNWFTREDLQASSTNGINLGAAYSVRPGTDILFSYTFSNTKYESNTDTSIHTLSGGLKQYITKQLYVDGRIGMSNSKTGTTQQTQPYMNVSLAGEIDERTTADLSYIKQFSTRTTEAATFDTWQASANFSRELTDKLRGNINGFYGEGRFGNDSTNKLKGLNLSLSFDIIKDVSGSLAYNHTKQETTTQTTSSGYTRNTITFGAGIAF
ncbi:MAG: hypothetical protein HY756_12005 [Nitrospirae bacterium]|nr:hypothetical protein [Nitrospirota bacterium]